MKKNLLKFSIVLAALLVAGMWACQKEQVEVTEKAEFGLSAANILSAPQSDAGIWPYIIPGANKGGNRTCSEVGFAFSTTFALTTARVDYEGEDLEIPVYNMLGVQIGEILVDYDAETKLLSFQIYVPGYCVGAAIVKGSNDANVYYYPVPVKLDSGLGAPPTTLGGNNFSDLSNITFCLKECDNGNGGGCETAFAFGDEYATCFDFYGFARWGWTNGPLIHGSYTFDIYAAAAQCDLTKGVKVGTLDVVYEGTTATVTYNITNGYFTEIHLYVGNEPIPKKGSKDTVAPGQYPYGYDDLEDDDKTIIVTGLSGEIYVIAHAVVCDITWLPKD